MSRAVVQSQPAIFPLVILVPLPRLRTHMAKKLMTTQSTLALWCLFPCGSDTWPLCHAPRYGWSHRHAPGSTLWAGELRQGFSQEASRLGQGWCAECKLLGWTGLFLLCINLAVLESWLGNCSPRAVSAEISISTPQLFWQTKNLSGHPSLHEAARRGNNKCVETLMAFLGLHSGQEASTFNRAICNLMLIGFWALGYLSVKVRELCSSMPSPANCVESIKTLMWDRHGFHMFSL